MCQTMNLTFPFIENIKTASFKQLKTAMQCHIKNISILKCHNKCFNIFELFETFLWHLGNSGIAQALLQCCFKITQSC